MTTILSATGIEGYRAFLHERDGEADLLNRTLTHREDFFAKIAAEPVRSRQHIDEETFLRNLRRRRPEDGLSPQMYWLLATAKLNQAERFGVGLGEVYGLNSGRDLPPEQVYLELEEHYHTRLLAHALDMFGLRFEVVPPPLLMRQIVKTAVFFPRRASFPAVGTAEMAGCTLFATLKRIGIELFEDEPDVAARIDLLYGEILVDEIGHVGCCAFMSSKRGRWLMRRLYPLIGRVLARQTTEILLLTDSKALDAEFRRPFDLDELSAQASSATFVAAHP